MSGATPSAGAPGRRGPAGWRVLPGLRGLAGRLAAPDAGGADWVSRLIGLAALIVVGVILGRQYLEPDKRMIAVAVATIVCGIAWRIDLVSGLGVLVLALPYPRGTVFGNTNVVLVLALLLIWLLRASLRQATPPHRTAADAPIVALLVAFILSFYNIQNAATLARACENFLLVLATMGMFYLIVNNVRRPEHLERVHLFQCVSIAMVGVFGVYELNHPDGVLIPGWIQFRHGASESINIHNLRIGGPFFDFELLSEYCAVNLPLVTLMLVRARSATRRAVFAGLFVLVVFIMFATVTRGGIVSLVVGVAYLGWVQRRRLRIVPVAVLMVTGVVGFQLMNYYVANFTNSGDLFARMLDPNSMQFKYGVPAARFELWAAAFERMMQYPILGHGPYYSTERGLGFWYWPHNGYLFVGNLVGFVGLACYLWLLARLWRLSRPPGDDLNDPDYARAYLVIGHVQLLVFMVDQLKIDFLRNPVYPFQVWLLFASIVAAYQVSRASPAARAPAPARR